MCHLILQHRKAVKKKFKRGLIGWIYKVEFGETASRERAAGGADASGESVEFAEGADPERLALDKRIRQYAKDNGVSYVAAAGVVMKSANSK